MLEDYYATKDRAERLRQKSRELYKAVHNMYDLSLIHILICVFVPYAV